MKYLVICETDDYSRFVDAPDRDIVEDLVKGWPCRHPHLIEEAD